MKPKKKRKIWWILAITLSTLIALPFSSYLISYQPSTLSKTAYQQAEHDAAYYGFTTSESDVGIIYYPGGLVNPRAYARFAQTLHQSANISVFVTQPLWHLAITSIQQAATIMAAHPAITTWVIGGHSLGGSSAAFFAVDHLETIAGLFFLASYPTAQSDVSESNIAVLSVTASEDQVLNTATYEDAKIYLPSVTTYASILGGNHGQFGSYGQQRGDGKATITETEQHEQTITIMMSWLASWLPKD